MKKLVHKILKLRSAAVSTVFADKRINKEWVLFGKFVIGRTFKAV